MSPKSGTKRMGALSKQIGLGYELTNSRRDSGVIQRQYPVLLSSAAVAEHMRLDERYNIALTTAGQGVWWAAKGNDNDTYGEVFDGIFDEDEWGALVGMVRSEASRKGNQTKRARGLQDYEVMRRKGRALSHANGVIPWTDSEAYTALWIRYEHPRPSDNITAAQTAQMINEMFHKSQDVRNDRAVQNLAFNTRQALRRKIPRDQRSTLEESVLQECPPGFKW